MITMHPWPTEPTWVVHAVVFDECICMLWAREITCVTKMNDADFNWNVNGQTKDEIHHHGHTIKHDVSQNCSQHRVSGSMLNSTTCILY